MRCGFNDGATLDITNTVLNAGVSGQNIGNFFATVTSHGYNLSSDAAGGDGTTGPGGLLNAPGDIRNTNPLLGQLQNNGGPTMTHALLSHSPAIDAGDPNFNPYAFDPPLLYDQRDGPRLSRASSEVALILARSNPAIRNTGLQIRSATADYLPRCIEEMLRCLRPFQIPEVFCTRKLPPKSQSK